jgi:hypothetical protein
MSSPHRKRRGAETVAAVALWFRNYGWPYAEPVGAGRAGVDVTGMPGIALEVKARRDLQLSAWLRQATKTNRNGGIPVVIHRPDGAGPAHIADWPATMRLEDLTALLRLAGYGDGLDPVFNAPRRPTSGPGSGIPAGYGDPT